MTNIQQTLPTGKLMDSPQIVRLQRAASALRDSFFQALIASDITTVCMWLMLLLAAMIEFDADSPALLWITRNTHIAPLAWKYALLACGITMVVMPARVKSLGFILVSPFVALLWLVFMYVREATMFGGHYSPFFQAVNFSLGVLLFLLALRAWMEKETREQLTAMTAENVRLKAELEAARAKSGD